MWGQEDDLVNYYHLLLEKCIITKTIGYSEFAIVIRIDENISCPLCGEDNHYHHYKSIADDFYLYISRYISTLLESISIEHFGLTLEEFGYEYSDIHYELAKNLPLKYRKQKKIILKLLESMNKLPIEGGKGGDSEILHWIIENAMQNTFALVFSAIIGYGFKFGKWIINKQRIRKRIAVAVKNQKPYLNDLTMDEIVKNLKIPDDYSGSKEQLIEEIVFTRAMEYKNTLIERVRTIESKKK